MAQFPPLIGRGLRDASPVIRATPDPPRPTLPRKQKLLSNTNPVLERHVMRLRLFCRVSLANDGVTKTRALVGGRHGMMSFPTAAWQGGRWAWH